MQLIFFIIIWIVVFFVLISFLPGLFYIIALIFNFFKKKKVTPHDTHYTLSQLKETKGKI
jgi:uncharacterized protein HemY